MRYAVALFGIFVLLGSGGIAKPLSGDTRDNIVTGMTLILKSWDEDRDGKLSMAEVQGMVDAFFARVAKDVSGGKMTPDLERQRQEFLRFYANQDTNHDGYLSLYELLKQPLAAFDCMDANHDGKLSKDALSSGSYPAKEDAAPHA